MPATTPERARTFIQDELDSAYLYQVLADHESDARLAEVYRRLAAAEARHADHWIAKLTADGVAVRPHRLGWRTRVMGALARRWGASAVVSIIASQEIADARRYASTADRAPGMDADERGHARALRAIAGDRGAEGAFISRAGTDRPRATRCAPRCSAPTTGSCPISAS
jgi:rubrerythrin